MIYLIYTNCGRIFDMKRIPVNFGWEYTDSATGEFIRGEGSADGTVDIPHTVSITPYDYFDESVYQKVCGYRKRIEIPAEWTGKRVFLNIGAAAHAATVYVNGVEIFTHLGGYTAFRAELTDHITPGDSALVSVKVDSRESLDIPPFGNVVDYMTYGGIYREIYLEVADRTYIEDVFVIPTADGAHGRIEARLSVDGDADFVKLAVSDMDGKIVAEGEYPLSEKPVLSVAGVRLWDVDSPVLYTLEASLIKDGIIIDSYKTRFGFRRAEFRADGFYLNGRKLKIVGLNRHQSYPYVGYAMPENIQKLDADILKYELGVNAVRTSHYPQSQHFIDRCDEVGLLVFTEIPGWQHIGGEEWKRVAVNSVRETVTQYRNHPSVILWGIRINESVDDDEFYRETNRVARELDPTRQTGGVRCFKKGSFLEDVYTYNDFSHDGTNAGVEKKKAVTSDMKKGYLVSEYNGHMFPTKTYDSEEHRTEHALRHANVLDAVAGEDDIAGSFGWCMFDYNTHRDFGSGDRVCYHGVLDMFRNPKTAAYVYSSMRKGEPFLELSSSFDIGENAASFRGRILALTNADSVRMYKNGEFVKEFTRSDSSFKNLSSPPIEIDDLIGDGLGKDEGFSPKQSKLVKDILNHSARFGSSKLPPKIVFKGLKLAVFNRMKFSDLYSLYGKYVSNWGDAATEFRFEAVKDTEVVKTVVKSPATSIGLEVKCDRTELVEADTYDAASVRIRAVDQNGNVLPFFMGSVKLEAAGAIEIIGPAEATLRGGCGGTYVRTRGGGAGTLALRLDGAEPVVIEFDVKKTDSTI